MYNSSFTAEFRTPTRRVEGVMTHLATNLNNPREVNFSAIPSFHEWLFGFIDYIDGATVPVLVLSKSWSKVSFAAISPNAEAFISDSVGFMVTTKIGAILNFSDSGRKVSSSFEAFGTSQVSNISIIVSKSFNFVAYAISVARVTDSLVRLSVMLLL